MIETVLILVYIAIVAAVTLYHESEHDYPPGRSLAAGLLWPLILTRLVAVEAWRIVRGA